MSLGETRKFNTFKVLRYADYEIRHSNVLAWLLHPSETHSVGDRFLEWFVRHINGRLEAAGLEILPEVDLAPLNVRVERELDYVNITIFFKREKYLITIENKTGPASAEHRDQIMAYEGTLRGKYEDYRIQSVLLTTSPDDKAQFPATAHMSWSSVRESIESLRVAGEFPSSSVQSFFRQYLELLENWLRPAGDGGFEGLLKEMRRVWEKDAKKGSV
ncbi:MAG: PD-(D/E)XK nuclease family protein [Bacteroidota bacterium]|nr:PD-(D/E)XK nuclease family protein [Bacteroidota bacterium]